MSSRERDCFNEINITPLTDIFLVLLIIMMVISPFLDQKGLNLAVPDNVEMEEIKETKIMTFTVTEDGKYLFDENEISISQLPQFIKDNKDKYPDGVLIQAEENAIHENLVRLMDDARAAGINNISIGQI